MSRTSFFCAAVRNWDVGGEPAEKEKLGSETRPSVKDFHGDADLCPVNGCSKATAARTLLPLLGTLPTDFVDYSKNNLEMCRWQKYCPDHEGRNAGKCLTGTARHQMGEAHHGYREALASGVSRIVRNPSLPPAGSVCQAFFKAKCSFALPTATNRFPRTARAES